MAGVLPSSLAVGINGSSGVGATTSSGASTGFAGGMPMFGGYLRAKIFGAPTVGRSRQVAVTPIQVVDSGTSPGYPGEGDTGMGPDYDPWLGLYVTNSYTETTYTTSLFLDAAKTKPAGSFVTTFPGSAATFPYSYSSVYSITGGTFAGSSGDYQMTVTSLSTGSMKYQYNWAGEASGNGSSSWSDTGSTWTNKTNFSDGSWYSDEGTFKADGSGSTVNTNSLGYKSSYIYNADGSGSGRIEGPDAGLPATIVWTSAGVVTITYADGTKETFNPWYLYDGGVVPVAEPVTVATPKKRAN
jgi:hypothetical protein